MIHDCRNHNSCYLNKIPLGFFVHFICMLNHAYNNAYKVITFHLNKNDEWRQAVQVVLLGISEEVFQRAFHDRERNPYRYMSWDIQTINCSIVRQGLIPLEWQTQGGFHLLPQNHTHTSMLKRNMIYNIMGFFLKKREKERENVK